MRPPSISVLIPTHNRADLLRQTLRSLAHLRLPGGVAVDALVVANACTDDTEAVVADEAARMPFPLRCVVEHEPGLSHARNRAVAESTGEVCAFLDDDVQVDPGWAEALADTLERYPADFVSGKVELWWEAVQRPAWVTDTVESLLSRLDYAPEVTEVKGRGGVIGANYAYRRAVAERIGGYRGDLGRVGQSLGAAEETEYLGRALEAGFRAFYCPAMRIQHWVSPHRVERPYLVAAAAGRGQSQVLMKESFGPGRALRSAAGHLYLAARHAWGRWAAQRRRDEAAAMHHLILRTIGQAGFKAALGRLLSGGRTGGERSS